ncbi:MAG: DinB family protein [Saprospiraceae bacterium]
MEQIKWFERTFNFESTENIFPSILERLIGTPARLEEKLQSLNSSILNEKIEGAWSVKEHAGHLSDLEPLWQGRLEDIIVGNEELRLADLQNNKTNNANHNDKSIHELLQTFRTIRLETLHLLDGIHESVIFKSALHPRLKTPMRTIDLFSFVADHDDHHLASMTAIIKELNTK